MYKISVIGHFGLGGEYIDGQTIKTKIIAGELRRKYGNNEVSFHDTHGGLKFLCKMPFVVFKMLFNSQHIIMMPAHNGLRAITPVIITLNILFRRHLHYVVIGGWLPEMVAHNRLLQKLLKKYDNIFVETQSMLNRMETMGFSNVTIMPNCKKLHITNLSEIPSFAKPPYPLCTFSRITKEKGIEDAIKAVKACNESLGCAAYSLDIYGQVDKKYQQRFHKLMECQPDYIKYRGCINYSESTYTLKNYFALLFPTYYEGECFAGTIIDAFAAGLPVIASDWHDNPNIIKNNENGIIFPTKSVKSISSILMDIYANPARIYKMRDNCIQEATKYQPDKVIRILTSRIQ